jgi:D-glycero-D-manno-heptose 1,7-bisphosphate phosphatase
VLFLDRDGVINRYVGNITKSTQLYVFPAISALIKRFNEAGYLVLVVTNQPVLSRGELTSEGLDQIHASIDEQLTKHGAYIDDYFICPHHPDDGFLGEISELKIVCECRKPKIGLISQSLMKYNLDFEHAIMLGDTWRDEELAAKIGVTYYSVDRNSSSEDEIDALIEKICPYEQWWKKYSLTN